MPGYITLRDDGVYPYQGDADGVIRSDTDPSELVDLIHLEHVEIYFTSVTDGKGFAMARKFRKLGYEGHLRAAGHVIQDQYDEARRSGFDELLIRAELFHLREEPEKDEVDISP